MSSKLSQGFATLKRETKIDWLPVSGQLPPWLSGTLVRNGPAKFEVGASQYRHWFDGLAMLHRFTFKEGAVSYANRFLKSRDYRDAMVTGKICHAAFATSASRSLFERLFTLFSPEVTENANVNVARIASRFLAFTETPRPIEFDPYTLKTLGVFDYGGDRFPGVLTTAHPHFDFARKTVVNYTARFARRSTYNVYYIAVGQAQRRLIGIVPVREPAYMHSFGMTDRFVILTEFPLFVNPLRLLLSGKPFIENYVWKPERGTRFIVMSKLEGAFETYEAEAFFAFHHVNAFERHGEIFVDIAAYPDKGVIDALYLDNLRAGGPIPAAELRRYRLGRGSSADYECLSSEAIEFPRLNYKRCNAHDYRFAYGISHRRDRPGDFPNQLVKVDVRKRAALVWHEEACYPSEPVFVAAPEARAEDGGVILSVVLDGDEGHSFLLVLEASTFVEIARAELPHSIPFGIHGQYFGSVRAPAGTEAC